MPLGGGRSFAGDACSTNRTDTGVGPAIEIGFDIGHRFTELTDGDLDSGSEPVHPFPGSNACGARKGLALADAGPPD